MQRQPLSRKQVSILLAIGLVALIVIFWIASIVTQSDTNQFGKFIRIQNYTSKVKNVSGDMRDATETSLYNTVVKNVSSADIASRVSDAYIRKDSEKQSYDGGTSTFVGEFIVDMESIKQSYQVSYSYSRDVNQDVGGDPVIISCLPKELLKFGEFKCSDITSEQTNRYDSILQHLPYQNFSFALSPDATQGDKLVIHAKLSIPESSLSGDAASRASVIAAYKGEVVKWIRAKGLNPDDYTIQYNYDEAGNFIPDQSTAGD